MILYIFNLGLYVCRASAHRDVCDCYMYVPEMEKNKILYRNSYGMCSLSFKQGSAVPFISLMTVISYLSKRPINTVCLQFAK